MKKLITILLLGVLLFSGIACAPKQEEVPAPTPAQQVSPPEGLTLSMQQATYYLDSAELVATLINDTEYTCTFGEASYLELQSGDGWQRVPFKEDVYWIEIAYILEPGESKEVVLPLDLFEGLAPGTYRLVKEVYCDDGSEEGIRATVSAAFNLDAVPVETAAAMKPVIYLYPQEETEVTVQLDFDGAFTCTYPAYRDGWHVLAQPDGRLTNMEDGSEYSYLFWEGVSDTQYDLSSGFVVKGPDTMAFLQEKLAFMGLTPKEYNEFIVYWLPRMQDNAYNLISFQRQAYTEHAALTINPQPDSILRVFMAYKALNAPAKVPEQRLTPFVREGFAVVEWGGAEIE